MKNYKVTGIYKLERTITEEQIREAEKVKWGVLPLGLKRCKNDAEKAQAIIEDELSDMYDGGDISKYSLDWVVEEVQNEI